MCNSMTLIRTQQDESPLDARKDARRRAASANSRSDNWLITGWLTGSGYTDDTETSDLPAGMRKGYTMALVQWFITTT